MTRPETTTINGDLSVRAVMDTNLMEWQASPSLTVWRKRLHLAGEAEAGQVTSIVRYEPGSSFPAHDHPDGEEILVLAGTFSDEHGDWPAGSYLLNPEGFRHAPFSEEGCVLFVKLRQYSGRGRVHVATNLHAMPWTPAPADGIEVKILYADERFPDRMQLQRWEPNTRSPVGSFADGAEIYVIEGSLIDEHGGYIVGTWLRLPQDSDARFTAPDGCEIYVKLGGVAQLRSA